MGTAKDAFGVSIRIRGGATVELEGGEGEDKVIRCGTGREGGGAVDGRVQQPSGPLP